MVKVVDDGGFKAKCSNCDATLKFTRDEVRTGERRPPGYDDYEVEYSSVITCPRCHRTVDVTSKVGSRSAEQRQKEDWSDYDL